MKDLSVKGNVGDCGNWVIVGIDIRKGTAANGLASELQGTYSRAAIKNKVYHLKLT